MNVMMSSRLEFAKSTPNKHFSYLFSFVELPIDCKLIIEP